MERKDWRPRLTIDVPSELLDEMSERFPWGTRNRILILACEQIVEAVKLHGEVVIYLLMNGKLKLFGSLEDPQTAAILARRNTRDEPSAPIQTDQP